MNLLQGLKPAVPRRYLLFTAALVWTFAGSILLWKGISLLINHPGFLVLKIMVGATGGALFYLFLFARISLKHATRIMDLLIEKPCFFSFFNYKSYILMVVMISSGILLRKSEILSPEYLAVFYITMGIPLFLSSIRFYYYGINYHHLHKNN